MPENSENRKVYGASMEGIIRKTAEALRRNGFQVTCVSDAGEAVKAVLDIIPGPMTIGIGDSATVRQLGIIDAIQAEGRLMINPVSPYLVHLINIEEMTGAQHRKIQRMALDCDYFLTGTNAVTETGALINIDAAGNRIAGMFFGPENVVIVVGSNKIVSDIPAGIDRIRNCCAPQHAKQKMRKTPCVVDGRCHDCHSPERICKVISVIEQKPSKTNIHIVLVDEDLGLGWDSSWDQERTDRIREGYAGQTKVQRPSWIGKNSYSGG